MCTKMLCCLAIEAKDERKEIGEGMRNLRINHKRMHNLHASWVMHRKHIETHCTSTL